MAIIQCPACAKRISNVNKVCPYCQANVADAQANSAPLRRRLKDDLYRIRMRGYVATSLVVLSIILWWVPTRGQLVTPALWLQGMFLLGLVGQLASRYFIIKIKRQLRALEEPKEN